MKTSLILSAIAAHVSAFPFVADAAGVDASLLRRQQPGGPETCPFNPIHRGPAPITVQYPYCGATGGKPGVFPCFNNRVPALYDAAHAFSPPGPNDIRGPCPGLNTMANHNFISHDGIATFSELLDAQQNAFGVGFDLANLLAVIGVALTGDTVTTKVSIGCDATSRTSAVTGARSGQPGLDGHNKFEGDTSLSRNDFFLGPPVGNDFSFNATLYKQLSNNCQNNCSRNQMAFSRYQRYQQSLNSNGNFYFGPKSVLYYGGASFLYQLFPSLGDKGIPNQATMDAFFVNQRFPDYWYSRQMPLTIADVSSEIAQLYLAYPVAFGGNTGQPNTFVGAGTYGSYITSNMLQATPQGIQCLLYQLATDNTPSSLTSYTNVSQANFQWAAQQLNPIYSQLGLPCPLRFT